jgi:hypothetical protein
MQTMKRQTMYTYVDSIPPDVCRLFGSAVTVRSEEWIAVTVRSEEWIVQITGG